MKINKERKKQIFRKLKSNKGITLIALVVTIIVLLILAGISIQMLVGEGGILTNAREAARKTNQADAKERLELEIAETLLEDKELTAEGLNKNLAAHLPELTHEGESLTDNPIEELPAIVELDGYVFQIDENGKVTAIDGIALSKSDLELQILTHDGETTNGEETLTATLIGISGKITWSKEGEAIEIVEQDGGTSAKITAKQAGTAKVTATCSGRTAECNVTVKEAKAVTSITLDPTEDTINEGDELVITATTGEGTEDLTWDWENTSGDTQLTITPSGDGKKKCTVVAQGAGKATVTAKSSQTKATCTITVESPYIDNSYVQYDVGYTDVYTKTKYTKNTGWRLLTKIEEEKDKYNEEEGTYEGDIEIISTGIPAKLYYYYSTIKDTTKAPWAGTEEQRNTFVADYYGTASNYNVYASAGLLYNFKQIVFNVKGDTLSTSTITENKGGFVNIVTNGTEAVEGDTTTGGSLFTDTKLESKITGIRSVNLKDLTGYNNDSTTFTEPRTGLFTLQNYKPDVHSSSTSAYYWLASPNPSSTLGVRNVNYSGNIDHYSYGSNGVRPVVSISNVHMRLNGHVWEIIN